MNRFIVACTVYLILLMGNILCASASTVLTIGEASLVAGGCESLCEEWWCPYGGQHDTSCNSTPCGMETGKEAPQWTCVDTPSGVTEKVSRILLLEGGTFTNWGTTDCGSKIYCICLLIDPPGTSHCQEQTGMIQGSMGTYEKCAAPEKPKPKE